MEILNCSSKELSDNSGISPASISRYRNGDRIPDFKSTQFNDLVNGLVKIAKDRNIKEISEQSIINDFTNTFGKTIINFDIFIENLNIFITKLNINMSKMAKSLNFDASYISRILVKELHQILKILSIPFVNI